jgi:hypothetical protein
MTQMSSRWISNQTNKSDGFKPPKIEEKVDTPCAHHTSLVPPFSEVCKLKSFELKSDCTTFHIKSEGNEPCSDMKKKPCPGLEQPCP